MRTHISTINWRIVLNALLAIVFFFSTATLSHAQTSNSFSDVLRLSQNIEQIIASNSTNVNGCPQMDNQQICCDKNENITPCDTDDSCQTTCQDLGISHALIMPMHGLVPWQPASISTPEYTVRTGIAVLLGAPPPRD
ncbi:MAG: hypothetical protein L3J65_06040 [Robiginitomaculum sp.]|nr:hypothetical protein [Robiginitomaculum sp.]